MAGVALATKIRDWETLVFAVEGMIADQRDFVARWDEHVGVRHGLNRFSIDNADQHSLSVEQAEALTGVQQ